jgi:GNAT superfamily N-acetyltransferase
MTTRTAAPADLDRIREITLAAYDEYSQVMPPPIWEAYAANIRTTVEETDPEYCIVATRDDLVVGSVYLFPADTPLYGDEPRKDAYPEVRLLAVPPQERGKGIGQVLMDECVTRARGIGARALGLHTTTVMEAALRMYLRMGFVRVPETDFTPAPGVTIMGFKLDLSA